MYNSKKCLGHLKCIHDIFKNHHDEHYCSVRLPEDRGKICIPVATHMHLPTRKKR